MAPAGSTRWCPTPEQVMILEEMYRSGIRTPNASQIQQITSHLSFYGKIQGKNVFYWFQNHKARERQKLRKKLSKQLQFQQHQQLYHLHYFDSMPSPAFQHLSYYNSARPFPQVGAHENAGAAAAAAKRVIMNYNTWGKFNVPEIVDVDDKSVMKTNGSDLLIMVDPSSPCYFTTGPPPIKTLELFPVTASNLKEECNYNNNNISSKPLSCNITTNSTPPQIALTLP